jgi:hypothetical protein
LWIAALSAVGTKTGNSTQKALHTIDVLEHIMRKNLEAFKD